MTISAARPVLAFVGVLSGVGVGAIISANPVWGLALVAVIASAAALSGASFRPRLWLHALVVATCFTAALPRGSLVPFMTPADLVLVLACGHLLVYLLFTGARVQLPRGLVIAALVLVVGVTLLPGYTYLVRDVSLDADGVTSLLSPLKFVLVFWLFASVPTSLSERRDVVRTMVVSATAVALIGLLQAAGVQPVVDWLRAWYPSGHAEVAAEVGRVTSVLGAWNALGNFLTVSLLLVVATYVEERHRTIHVALRLCALVLVACLIATNLYSGIIGAALGVFVIKAIDPRGSWLVWLVATGAAVAGIFLAPQLAERWAAQFSSDSWIPQTLRYRMMVWGQYFWPDIMAQPFWGVAPTYAHLPFPFPESQYVHYLYRSGLWSLVAHVVWVAISMVWLVRRAGRRLRLEHGYDRAVALATAVALGAFTLIGLINPVFTYTAGMTLLWAMLGLVANAAVGGHDGK